MLLKNDYYIALTTNTQQTEVYDIPLKVWANIILTESSPELSQGGLNAHFEDTQLAHSELKRSAHTVSFLWVDNSHRELAVSYLWDHPEEEVTVQVANSRKAHSMSWSFEFTVS